MCSVDRMAYEAYEGILRDSVEVHISLLADLTAEEDSMCRQLHSVSRNTIPQCATMPSLHHEPAQT